MATINFPTSPATDDSYDFNGRSWRWTGLAWAGVTVVGSSCPDYSTLTLREVDLSYTPPLGSAIVMQERDCSYTPPVIV